MPKTPVRVVPYGRWSTLELCSKTHMAAFLLRPDAFMSKLPLGFLARCLKKYRGVQVHKSTFMSNHYHLLVSAFDAVSLARFMNLFNSLLARAVNLHLGRHDAVWARPYSASRVAPSQERERALYLFGQGLAEGLFERAHHNPCAHAVEALTEGTPLKGIDVDLGAWSRARQLDPTVGPEQFSKEVTVPLTPLPSIAHLSPQAQQAWWRQVGKDAEAQGAAERTRRNIKRVLGAVAMRLQNPFGTPRATKRGRSAPLWHADFDEAVLLEEERKAILAQRAAAQEALVRHLPHVGWPPSVHLPTELACRARQCSISLGEGLHPDG